MKKKLLAIITALVMVLSLSACGGGSSEGAAEAAEPNAGVANIVFSVPDSWALKAGSMGSYADFATGSDYEFYVSTYDAEDLEQTRLYSEEEVPDTIQEQYEKDNSQTDEELAADNTERSTLTICDTDAYYYKYNKGDGITGLSVTFLKDDVIYYFGMGNGNNYDDEGNFKSDPVVATDEDVAAFESVIESVENGDGDAILAGLMVADSLGSIAFEVPAGYTINSLYSTYIEFLKDGSEDIRLSVSLTTEDDLQWYMDEDGNVPESLEAEYAETTEWYTDEQKTTIAGFDGYKAAYPYEDDVYYDCGANFFTGDEIYNINLSSDAWDEEGNIKEGAEALTEDDLAAFDAFLASMKTK